MFPMAFMDTENASSSSLSFPSSSSSSSSSSTPGWKYDVFLSFRGTDTRKNFTDHLYAALSQKGIFTFRDDEKLERGTFIAPELLSAIEDSRFAVVILSRDYASSSWCLIELAKIVECMEKKGLIVLPVFHYVDPSDVRNQRGAFAEAFVKHQERFKDKIEDVYTWRAALTQVASIAGWDLHDKHEAKVIEEMVRKILGKLNSTYSVVHKDLVGINSRMEEMVKLLAIGLNDVRFVGICGMGGMGKTTLARLIYNKLHYCFEGSSFIANVREESKKHGLVPLQKRLLADIFLEKNIDFLDVQWGINMIGKRLCHKRVLVILDDVDQLDQLEALVGERNWFGQGSRIIITTRYQHLLIRHEVVRVEIYKARKLNDDEALHFFGLKAFKKDYPLEGYEDLSQKVICYAQGLPLALEVLGRFLFRRSVDEWKSALCRLKESPERQISDVLKITFDGLREREKNIFLDIACFFKGMEEDHVVNILQALYDKPKIDIVVLLEKSLITISFGKFWMHDLLQELGKEIVRCESPEEPGRRSRLWLTEDVIHVLKCNTGKEVVKSIFLDSPPRKEERLNAEAFSKMKNLRLLKISNVHFPQGLKYLSSELRFIHWDGYPLESMPTSFEPEKLVELIMPCSLVKGLWKGIKGNFKETSGYDMIIPGSKIPKWFSYHSEGASLNLQVLSLLCNKLMGIVLCVVFALREHHPLDLIDSANWGFLRITHQLTCSFKVNGYDKPNKKEYCFSEQYGKIESNHLWVSYVPPPYFNQVEELSQIDANGFNKIEFEFETFGPGLEIKKCGVHLVFKENIEDCNQTMAQCSNSNITPYEDEFDDSAKDSKNKRRRSHDDYDGARPSEEGSFNDLLHPKRIRLPNIIERFVPRLGNLIGNLTTQDDSDDEKSQ